MNLGDPLTHTIIVVIFVIQMYVGMNWLYFKIKEIKLFDQQEKDCD